MNLGGAALMMPPMGGQFMNLGLPNGLPPFVPSPMRGNVDILISDAILICILHVYHSEMLVFINYSPGKMSLNTFFHLFSLLYRETE